MRPMSQLFATESDTTIAGYAQVAIEQGIDAALTYAIPLSMRDVAVGQRVTVPLGRTDRPAAGIVVSTSNDSPYDQTKTILSRDEHEVALTLDLVELACWMAGYYCCPMGMVLSTMLPAAVKRGTGAVEKTYARIADAPADGAPTTTAKLTKLQQAVLDAATARGDWVQVKELADLAGARSVSPVKQLISKGLLETCRQEHVHAHRTIHMTPAENVGLPQRLTEAQQHALDQITSSMTHGFGVHLLHGVTGSGKTEVYLRAIEHLHATSWGASDDAGGHPGAIVLVPEIALTPQTVGRFHSRFNGIAVLHSGLTDAQRHEQWRRIRDGDAHVIVGARSAVFAPIQDPGVRLIIVDEEHDASYKQDQLPRYHARDVAIKRAQLAGATVVLGSATPSLESYFNATNTLRFAPGDDNVACRGPVRPGSRTLQESHASVKSESPVRTRYSLLRLPQRVTGLKLPSVQIVDMSQERQKRYEYTGKASVHLLSLKLEAALRQTFKAGGQAMLLLNRRGYANYIACANYNCGWIKNCDYCDVMMVYHRHATLPTGGMLCCHHCGAEQLLPKVCPVCGKRVTVFGLGTQRVEEEIQAKFPAVTSARMDSDAMRTGRHYHETLEQFRRGQVQMLVGTQMIAKGLDFPNVRVVGVISADTSLHLPDFRASERTFQMLAQVAGRCGRGEHSGTVYVQTYNPSDSAIMLASRHDYETFATREIEARRSMHLPPITRMARLVVRDRDHAKCFTHACEVAQKLQRANLHLDNIVRLRGPVPCVIARLAGYHRQQIELIAPDAPSIQRLLTAVRNTDAMRSDARTAVDVDPVALM